MIVQASEMANSTTRKRVDQLTKRLFIPVYSYDL